jgi:hypothetical protein
VAEDTRIEIYGPFDVLEQLGVGGMATVHRAVERGRDGFERVVALKRPLPHLAEDEAFLSAFVHEARLASLLHHENIVEQYELGRVGHRCFISMEYIPGRDMRAIVRQARLVGSPPPVEVALALLDELLHALDHAHTLRGPDGAPLGLVHRDISPANLIVSTSGRLKVIDFGIARASHGMLLRNTGRIKGKLAYMAPETLAGQLDGRSDLFSAAVTAHELLTALPLFGGGEDAQTIDRVRNMAPPPPSSVNRTCPRELDEILLRGLAKDPAERWHTAAEMSAAVAEIEDAGLRRASRHEVIEWVEWVFAMEPLELPSPGESSEALPAVDPRAGVDGPTVDRARPHAEPAADDGPTIYQLPHERLPAFTPERRPAIRLSGRFGLFAIRDLWAGVASRWSLAMRSLRRATARWSPRPALLAAAVAVAGSGAAILWLVPHGDRGAEMRARSSRAARPITPGSAVPSGAVAGAARPRSPDAPEPSAGAGEGGGQVAAGAAGAGESGAQVGAGAAGAGEGGGQVAVGAANRDRRVDAVASAANRGRRVAADGAADRNRGEPTRATIDRRAAGGAYSVAGTRTRRGPGELGAAQDAHPDGAPQAPVADRPFAVEDSPSLTSGWRRGAFDGDAVPPRSPDRLATSRPGTRPARPQPSRSLAATVAEATGEAGRAPIIVPASRTRRESGDVPRIHLPAGDPAPGALTARLCIDQAGRVTSVTVLSAVSATLRASLGRALAQWRYRPVIEANERVPVCFANDFLVQVE